MAKAHYNTKSRTSVGKCLPRGRAALLVLNGRGERVWEDVVRSDREKKEAEVANARKRREKGVDSLTASGLGRARACGR